MLAGVVLADAMGGIARPASAAAPPGGHTTAGQQSGSELLRIGSRGLAVRERQRSLNGTFTGSIATVDHPVLTVDGVDGPRTAATRAVQAAADIAQDGP